MVYMHRAYKKWLYSTQWHEHNKVLIKITQTGRKNKWQFCIINALRKFRDGLLRFPAAPPPVLNWVSKMVSRQHALNLTELHGPYIHATLRLWAIYIARLCGTRPTLLTTPPYIKICWISHSFSITTFMVFPSPLINLIPLVALYPAFSVFYLDPFDSPDPLDPPPLTLHGFPWLSMDSSERSSSKITFIKMKPV